MNQQDSPPIKEFRAPGGLSAAIWENATERDGRTVVWYSIKIQRSFRDKNSKEWRTTNYFRPQDLPRVARLAEDAFRFVDSPDSEGADDSEE
jgi:hypothetical protein